VNTIYNYYNNPSLENINNNISFEDTVDVFNDLKDLNDLLELDKQTIEYYQSLSTKKGFYNF
jgi:hypothetical protein